MVTEKLVDAVGKQLGLNQIRLDDGAFEETLADVCRGGADAGWPGFTWTLDCVQFFKVNRREIVAAVVEMAGDCGESVVEFVAGFRCLNGEAEEMSIVRCLGGGRLTPDDDAAATALAWFALEEVARQVCDLAEIEV